MSQGRVRVAGDYQGDWQLWSRIGVPLASRLRQIVGSSFRRLESVAQVVTLFGDLADRAVMMPSCVLSDLLALLRRVSFGDARAVLAAKDLAVEIHIPVIDEPVVAHAMPSW